MENNKNTTTTTTIILVLVVILGFVVYGLIKKPAPTPTQDNTPVVVTPTAAISGDTANFVAFSIAPGATVSGPVTATGIIKGAYFFEANIRVNILDANKVLLKAGHGTATTDWMTSDAVSFTTNLDFTGIPSGNGYIRIMNDNPSGDPVNDKFIDIPVVFQ